MPHKYEGPEITHPTFGHGLKVIVDAANVAYENQNGPNDRAKIENIILMRERLEKLGYCPIFIADAALRYKVDQPERLDHMEQSGQIMQAPAGTQADYFCLATAERNKLPVISNDFYRDREREFPTAVKDLRVPFMIVDGQVILEQERLLRAVEIARSHPNEHQHCHDTDHRHGSGEHEHDHEHQGGRHHEHHGHQSQEQHNHTRRQQRRAS